MAGTYEPGVALKIYINGQFNNELTENVPAEQHIANTVRIGMGASTFGAFAGSIDEARIYDRSLSEDDILALTAR